MPYIEPYVPKTIIEAAIRILNVAKSGVDQPAEQDNNSFLHSNINNVYRTTTNPIEIDNELINEITSITNMINDLLIVAGILDLNNVQNYSSTLDLSINENANIVCATIKMPYNKKEDFKNADFNVVSTQLSEPEANQAFAQTQLIDWNGVD